VKAFVVDKYKKKGALLLVNMPETKLQDNDVLIRVHATAVNLWTPQAVQGGCCGLFATARSSGRYILRIHCRQ